MGRSFVRNQDTKFHGGVEPRSLAASRSRRELPDKYGKRAAFAKLKELKGSKHKVEVAEVKPVYEEVDEREYSRSRQRRMESDWIVDDDGSGYVEDGREIFDEEDDADDEIFTSKKGARSAKKAARQKEAGQPSIRSLLSNMPVRKRKAESEVSLADDEILGDILEEMTSSLPRPSLVKKPRQAAPLQPPVNPFASNKPQATGDSPAVNSLSKAGNSVSRSSNGSVDQSPARKVEGSAKLSKMDQPPTSKIEGTANQKPSSALKPKPSVASENQEDSGRLSPPAGRTPPTGVQTGLPRPVFRENLPAVSPPKAKRSLAAAAEKEETEEDFADMDFSMLDDMGDDEQQTLPVPTAAAAVQPQSEEKNKVPSVVNRGFTVSSDPKEKNFQKSLQWETHAPAAAPSPAGPAPADVNFNASNLPLSDVDGEQVVRMYWLDAYEEPYRLPGVVFLFGKVWLPSREVFVSCCCAVRNVERRVFLLPRAKKSSENGEEDGEEVTMQDVYEEFNTNVAASRGITEFKSRPVTRGYAFHLPDVPDSASYLEVRYSATHPPLPAKLTGKTFSHVFGHTSGALETFLLELKLRGPCWLDLRRPTLVNPPLSWCKLEVAVESPTCVRVSSGGEGPPPLVVATLMLRTVVNPKTRQSEVVAVACLVNTKFPLDKPPPTPPYTEHFCVLTRPGDAVWPWDMQKALAGYKPTKVHKTDSERALLGYLLSRLQQLDPDVVTGHRLLRGALSVLLHRLKDNKVPHWSRLGRLRRTLMPKLGLPSSHSERTATCGRLVCDVELSAKELIRARSYDLPTLASHVLGGPTPPPDAAADPTAIRKMFEASEGVLRLVTEAMQDCLLVLRLMCELCILPLALQITSIAGNVLSRTLVGGRSERNEFLLLHAFTERGYIPPDKQSWNKGPRKDGEDFEEETAAPAEGGRRKAAYAGGLVLDPKKGFYDKYVLLLDFNSLYPSIIQEYNICFTTVDRRKLATDSEQLELPEEDQAPGVLPTEIRKLVDSRRSVKQLMAKPDLPPELRMQYDIRQKALKLTANSMYGCLGFSQSRFSASHLAAMVTGKGREILLQTRDLVQKQNLEVIYGDTDSIMVNTNSTDYDHVLKLGNKIKTEVNKLYRLLELDIDGVYRYMLLLKKKKYAALTVTRLPGGELATQQELKGLDIVRRDWSQLASNAGRHVLQQVLSDQSPDERVANIHAHLESLAARLRGGEVDLRELVVTKQLTKRPDDYPDKASLPHVQVALRLNASFTRFKPGDTVPYVVCKDGTDNPMSQRAYHPEELRRRPDLVVDTQYYLTQQLHPVVARLCDPIDGTDAGRIAECLGLDPSTYRTARQYGQEGGADDGPGEGCELPPQERFRGCKPFSYTCPGTQCGTLVVVDAPFIQGGGGRQDPFLARCPHPQCGDAPLHHLAAICNCLTRQLRGFLKSYYDGWLLCEDPSCKNRCRRMPLSFIRGFPICSLCRKGVLVREYTESDLYKQLSYFDYIFDFQKACVALKDDRLRDTELRRAYDLLRGEVLKVLNRSAYSHVNLGVLFSNLLLRS